MHSGLGDGDGVCVVVGCLDCDGVSPDGDALLGEDRTLVDVSVSGVESSAILGGSSPEPPSHRVAGPLSHQRPSLTSAAADHTHAGLKCPTNTSGPLTRLGNGLQQRLLTLSR